MIVFDSICRFVYARAEDVMRVQILVCFRSRRQIERRVTLSLLKA